MCLSGSPLARFLRLHFRVVRIFHTRLLRVLVGKLPVASLWMGMRVFVTLFRFPLCPSCGRRGRRVCRWHRRGLCQRRVGGSCGGGGLSVVMVCRMAMVAAFMEDILCGVRFVRVVALRRGAALGNREATWSCNCWFGRCGRGCCFEVWITAGWVGSMIASVLSVSGVMRIGAELSSPVGVTLSDRRSRTAVLTMQYGRRGLCRMSRRRLYHCKSCWSDMRMRWLFPRVSTE